LYFLGQGFLQHESGESGQQTDAVFINDIDGSKDFTWKI